MYCHPNPEDASLITSQLNSWGRLSPKQIHMERLSGLSNGIWKVSALIPSIEPNCVILRKFGNGSNIVDRHKENYVLRELSQQKVGPKYYAGDDTYRIEKFYDSRVLTPQEVQDPAIQKHMAKSIADLHSVDLPELDKTPLFLRMLNERACIKECEEKAKRDVYTPQERKFLNEIMTLFSEEESSFLKGILPTRHESVVFSHNDLHAQNVLVLDKNQSLLLIDYEYSDYNYRGYDIANFFNECMFEYHTQEPPFYTFDEKKFPSNENLTEFIRYYLLFYKFTVEEEDCANLFQDPSQIDSYVQKNMDLELFNAEVQEIFEEVKICRLLSHYYWVIWAIMMSKQGDFEFDHIDFAYKRFGLYHKLKRQLEAKGALTINQGFMHGSA